MESLHFGAGNIGRGVIGKLLSDSGFNVIFVDINQFLIDAINYHKKYNVRLVSEYQDKIECVKNVSAIHIDNPNIIKIIANVTIITTAVGFNILDKIAIIIAKGLIYKMDTGSNKPLNIISCENKFLASSYLKKVVLSYLPIQYHGYLKKYIGFVDCSIDSIIPSIYSKEKDMLLLIIENFQEWIVNSKQFKGDIPNIKDMKLKNNIISYIERKLFTLNTGHAIAAYLGLIQGYETIQSAIQDHHIYKLVKNAMRESGEVLIKKYNFNKNDHFSYINHVLSRFKNPFLLDPLKRIARNPVQKLDKEERLFKPALGAIKYNFSYSYLIKGIAAALYYRNENDLESIQIGIMIKKYGIKKSILTISRLDNYADFISDIIAEYNVLLS
ncbi:mannitol-1-phosphate 5-dehydrogenase [Buchnera aphidicola]|uniref:mannitol-1-phosphate 5-dehydrogenase n=1 Tax=Buchnera aphidicola TaxID=9 RepID=UPI003BEEC34F